MITSLTTITSVHAKLQLMFFRGVKTLLSIAAGILAAGRVAACATGWIAVSAAGRVTACATGRGSGASACGAAWLRGGRGDEDVGCIFEGGVEVKTVVGELACGTGTELDALYVLCHGEGFLRVGSLLGSDANGENGEVVDLHGVAAEDEFLDALHHVGEDAAYGSCREGCVVARHVLGELVDADGCGDCRTGIVLAVRSWELFVVVFY